jgi:predicted amidohydrolase
LIRGRPFKPLCRAFSSRSSAISRSCSAALPSNCTTSCELFGHSIIVNPQGKIITMATSWDDELIIADCNLEMCRLGCTTIFAFKKHRRPETYTRITTQVGAAEPAEWVKRAAD